MLKEIYRSVIATIVFGVILCGIYPLAVAAFGQIFFHEKANGGIILGSDGKALGAHLIGQAFSKPEYFHGRPSAAGSGYDASNSSGSNLGPTNQKFADTLKANIEAVLKDNPDHRKGEIPPDLVTASGSGLDPHVSPEGARFQVERVARARGADKAAIAQLVADHVEGPQLGLLGEPVVNVLELNLDLDRKFPVRKSGLTEK